MTGISSRDILSLSLRSGNSIWSAEFTFDYSSFTVRTSSKNKRCACSSWDTYGSEYAILYERRESSSTERYERKRKKKKKQRGNFFPFDLLRQIDSRTDAYAGRRYHWHLIIDSLAVLRIYHSVDAHSDEKRERQRWRWWGWWAEQIKRKTNCSAKRNRCKRGEEASIFFVFDSVFFLIKNDVFTSLSSSIALFIRQHRQRYDYIENSTSKKREERRGNSRVILVFRSFDFVWIGSMSHHCSLNCYFSLGLAPIDWHWLSPVRRANEVFLPSGDKSSRRR